MPTIELPQSPHAAGHKPVHIYYREFGRGRPLVILHGGWGYGVYPFQKQIESFQSQRRLVIPDRTGYGRSTRVNGEMPLDFHQRAAQETLALLDALNIQKAAFWGHSDGAVIAAMLGLRTPERCEALILEAFHYLRRKPKSRSFFERFTAHPEDLGEETKRMLAEDHGEADWKRVPARNCGAWIRIADQASQGEEDLYAGKLGELRVPTLFLHGRLDPRTEPGEMEMVRARLPHVQIKMIENGKHSPHSEAEAFEECNALARAFLSAAT
ncbi:MAG TPA: alpha/beta hydrolase [Candidatus Acidoferrum sp.]|nr:alpha/beta hydrolase [Candidatus Acidoferrum sp.]